MGRPQECAKLVKNGETLSRIAKQLGINPTSVLHYLYRAIGEGLATYADILFSLTKEARKQVEEVLSELSTDKLDSVHAELERRELSIDKEDLRVYLELRRRRVPAGDLYELISELERTLHQRLERLLKMVYGEDESGWWRRGIPESIRINCAMRRESDEAVPADPSYSYTTFFDLVRIIDKNWGLLEDRLPAGVAADKRQLLRSLRHAAQVRNRVMHPARGRLPSQDDLELVRELHQTLVIPDWQLEEQIQ